MTAEEVLKMLTSKAMRGVEIPAGLTIHGLDYAAQAELENFFGVSAKRKSSGKVSFPLPGKFRDPTFWMPYAEKFGIERVEKLPPGNVFERMRLLYPGMDVIIDALAERGEVVRFVSDEKNAKDWIRLFRRMIERLSQPTGPDTSTLSQLGSDWFGDSKRLRSGPLYRQLVLIVAAINDMFDVADDRTILSGVLIIDNPYTSHVTFSAPVSLIMDDGAVYDFPSRMFARRMAVQLPLETVLKIKRLEWDYNEVEDVTTCENAAPFATLVADGITCAYTEGYANFAVKVLLHKFAETGAECIHEGDADLDGFRIAKEVSNVIPLKSVLARKVLDKAPDDAGIELTAEQRRRYESFLSDIRWRKYPFAPEIRRVLQRGRWIEQESFARILAGK